MTARVVGEKAKTAGRKKKPWGVRKHRPIRGKKASGPNKVRGTTTDPRRCGIRALPQERDAKRYSRELM